MNGVESFALNGNTNSSDTLPAWMSRDGHRYLVWKTFLAKVATVTVPVLVSQC